MKGARILDFDKLRDVTGDYQQLNYAQGAVELPLYCAEALDQDRLGVEFWYKNPSLPWPDASAPATNSAPGAPSTSAVVLAGRGLWEGILGEAR